MVVTIVEPGCLFSHTSFHVTRARKDDKADKTRFFFAKKDVTRQTIVQ